MLFFVVDCVKFDENARTSKLPELLEQIFTRNLDFRKTIGENDMVSKNIPCLKLLLSAILKASNSLIDDCIYVFGGYNGTSTVSKFDSSSGIWSKSGSMFENRTRFDCVSVQGKIYLCGGQNDTATLNTVEVFDSKTQTFQYLTPMNHARSGCAVAAIGGFLYLAGGHNGTNAMDIVERYSIEENRWEDVTPMQTSRNGLKLVEHEKKLFALGGNDGQRYLETV